MKKYAFIAVLLTCACVLRAQSITSYTCDFEDPTENAQWVLNSGPKASGCNNQWYVGAAGGAFGLVGSNGLYVSVQNTDTDINTYSTTQSEYVTSYRELTLAAGTYTLRFDWRCYGDSADGIFVFWVDDATTNTNSNWDKSRNLSVPRYAPTGSPIYRGRQIWQSTTTTITSTGATGKLVVVWYNIRNQVFAPAGAIDNIEIYPGVCAAPTAIHYDGDNSSLSWSGSATEYDVVMYNAHTETTSTYYGIRGNSLKLNGMSDEGMYHFYIRSACDANCHSKWVFTSKFVWLKGARCIDMFDLTPDNSGAAKCFSGSTENIKLETGQVDFGYQDEQSLHTIHYVQDERDPRTGNQLKTIPDGEIASIRLGGLWLSDGNKSSTVEYEYSVEAGVSDLLELKYATILEYADYHAEDDEARFKLEVLSNGVPVDACGQRDFKAGFGETGSWHRYLYQNPAGGERDIFWSDWQTVTISLRDYVNQTLTIRLTAYSCTATIHIGYAYFTINCRGGDLQGIACGDYSTDHFEAPEGFNYRWYRADDPTKTVLGTDQVFNIAADDPSVYLLDCIDRTKSNCYYTLEANPNPRFPQAKGNVKAITGSECVNHAEFAQTCSVVRINRQTYDSIFTDEPVESVVWDFGDGSAPVATMDKRVFHEYPKEGGEYRIKLTTSMSNGLCEDSCCFNITVPNITTPDSHDSIHYCEEGTDWNDTTYLQNNAGCEYKSVRHHMFHPRYEASYSDRICEGGRYYFPGDGKYYTSSIDTTLALQSRFGCDSLISLHLIVDPRLEVEYPHLQRACLEDNVIEIPYQIVSGSMDSIKVYFSAEDQARGFDAWYGFADGEDIIIPIPDGIRPDLYNVKIEFGGERCQMDLQSMQLMLTYPTSIVMQNGGFIAVQNDQYNGGHKFNSFVWYRNGELMDTNASYVPTTPMDEGATYVLSLVREGEHYAVESCPIVYNPTAQGLNDLSEEVLVWPTAVQAGANLWIAPSKGCTIYSVLGTEVIRYPQSDIVRTVSAPTQPGMYLVVFDNHQSATIIVR